MDKDVMKRLLKAAGIPVAKFIVLTDNHKKTYASQKRERTHKFFLERICDGITFSEVVKLLNVPFFVKPANLGSSIGVAKVHKEKEFLEAVDNAFSYDRKILLEECIVGRELECSVLGNDNPIASVAGEVIPSHEFYSYDAKYIDEEGARLIIPADVSEKMLKKLQILSVKAFQTLCCEGMARVDFFLTKHGKLYVNEINTIPGFTKISMYPKLWEVSGIGYTELIDRLIQLAMDRFEREQKLKTSVKSS
jgi:D-alanine-D-alanine ligase